jgi:hypothetical protein
MGMPKIAASTSAPMYCLERITATGSTTGDPLGGVGACWLTSLAGRLLELFESGIW